MTWGVFICGVPWDLASWYQSWFFFGVMGSRSQNLEEWSRKGVGEGEINYEEKEGSRVGQGDVETCRGATVC